MRFRAVRIGTVTAGALLALAMTTGPASAHTSLKEASPAIGSTVSPPSQILLTFADPVTFPQVVLIDSAGGRHESGKAQAVDNKVTEQVAGTLASGVYTVGWRVVAVDGHPVNGEYRFTVKGGAPAAVSGSSGSRGSGTVAGQAPNAAPHTAAGSSSTGWWWIGLAALLGVGLIAGITVVRKILSP
ncbi:MAG: copper resistance protein CopC [Actinomycetia bacterium]|nr:copper resistance protein CopC [Actinomycetes bacterium]